MPHYTSEGKVNPYKIELRGKTARRSVLRVHRGTQVVPSAVGRDKANRRSRRKQIKMFIVEP